MSEAADVLVQIASWFLSPFSVRPMTSWVVGTIMTGSLGEVLPILKSADRQPKSMARIESPSTMGKPSKRPPIYSRSRSDGVTLVGVKTTRSAGRQEIFFTTDVLVYTRFCVLPGQAIQLHPGLVPHFLVRGHGFADGRALSHNFYDVTDRST